MVDALRYCQMAVDLSASDPTTATIIIGSPLTVTLTFRGVCRLVMGFDGWREDFERALAMARTTDPVSLATHVAYKYIFIAGGVLLADDAALTEIDQALQVAEQSSDDIALVLVRIAEGIALIHRGEEDRKRGFEVLAQLREMCVKRQYALNAVPMLDVYAARKKADLGDSDDDAVRQLRAIADDVFTSGNLGNADVATAALVETLLAHGCDDDLAEAEVALDRFGNVSVDWPWAARDITLLRLRALLAKARGDEAAYRDYRERYRAMATELGFEGHMAMAEAMP